MTLPIAEPTTPTQPRRAFVAIVMGLPVSIHVRGPRARTTDVESLAETAFDALRGDDALFSTYRPDSQVSRIRAGDLPVADAHPRVRTVARLCDLASARTGGAFSARLPGPDGRPRFDPTGMVKGWAVDQALAGLLTGLDRLGPHDVLVCAGGDIAAVCRRTDTPDWEVGIEDPSDRSRLLRRVSLRTGAVATSGTAARGRHILDPASGNPVADNLLSATVVGPLLTWADVYATAAFVRGPAALVWLAGLPGHVSVLVEPDGTVLTTGATAQPESTG